MGEIGTAVAPFWGIGTPGPTYRWAWLFHDESPSIVSTVDLYSDDAGGDHRFHTDIFDGSNVGMIAILIGVVRGELYAPPDVDWNYSRYYGNSPPWGSPYKTGGTDFAWDYGFAGATSGGVNHDYEDFLVFRPIDGTETLPSDGDGDYIPLVTSAVLGAWMTILLVDPGFAWQFPAFSGDAGDYLYRDWETAFASHDPPLLTPVIYDDPEVWSQGHWSNSTADGGLWFAFDSDLGGDVISGVPTGYSLVSGDMSAAGSPDYWPRWRCASREADSAPNDPSTFTADYSGFSRTMCLRAYHNEEVEVGV